MTIASPIRLLALGTATPPGQLTLQQSIDLAKNLSPRSIPEGLIETLHRRTGIQNRGVSIIDSDTGNQSLYQPQDTNGPTTSARLALYTKLATPIARDASTAALARASLAPDRITHLITASCTGFDAPGIDQSLVWELKLNPGVSRTHIGFMGCHAAINALSIARSIAAADPRAKVLVCCVELSSLHMHFSDRVDQLIANSLFADGAAAAVIAQSQDVSFPELKLCASRIFPSSSTSMSWKIGDHGFEMSLGPEVPDLLTRHVPPWIDYLLDSAALKLSQIRGWAIHPGGPKIVESIAKSLNLPPHATASTLKILQTRGNMSSPTVLFILEELTRTNTPRPWLTLAFGPGLAAEAAIFT